MVGRELTNVYPPKGKTTEQMETVLKVEHLCSIHERSFQDCSFELKKGEILGFGGLVGAQRTEMMEAIFGMRHIASGTVEVLGKKVDIQKPEDAIDNSIGYDHRRPSWNRYLRMPQHQRQYGHCFL